MENMRKDEEEIKDECGKIREEQKVLLGCCMNIYLSHRWRM